MDTTVPSLPHLFQQLGLPAGPDEMAAFLRDHQLPAAVRVSEAAFWTESQRQFLQEEWREDAEWAIAVDALNEALHAAAATHGPRG